MAMRSIWKGSITFLLISIPVKVYNALETSEKISFNQLHAGDCLGPVGQKKQCKKCDAVLTSNEEITKGYQYEPDLYITVSPDEIATITRQSNETIQIIGFINPDEIPTTYFDASYFAAPNGTAAAKPYALLREVMKRTGKVAIAKVTLREREELIAISTSNDGIMIQKLRYNHEVRSISSVPGITGEIAAQENELELAEQLVNSMITTFAELDTVDHHHVALKNLLDAKIAGKPIDSTTKPTTAAPVTDIMSALRASLTTASKTKLNKEENTDAPPPLTLVPPVPKEKPRKQKVA